MSNWLVKLLGTLQKLVATLPIGIDWTSEQGTRGSYSALRKPASPHHVPGESPACLDKQTIEMPVHARIGPSASGRVNQKVAP
jgi:hypothetical protein